MKSSISPYKYIINLDFALWLSWTLLVLPVAGVEMMDRTFVKIHAGPLYVLEIFFLAWLLSSLFSKHRFILAGLPKQMPPVWVFAGWGGFLTMLLFLQHPEVLSIRLSQRIAQHTILFLYPLMWMSAGAWLWQTDRTLARRLLWIIFLINAGITILHDFDYTGYSLTGNISIGPLLTIAVPLLLDFIIDERADRFRHYLLVVLWFLVSGLAFCPFWQMWLSSAQRTSLLLFFVLLFTVPFAIRRQSESWLRTAVLLTIPLLYFTAGIILLSIHPTLFHRPRPHLASFTTIKTIVLIKPRPSPVLKGRTAAATPICRVHHEITQTLERTLAPKQIEQQFLKVMRHGEDIPGDPNSSRFEFRTRGYMWKRSLFQWRHHPVFGVGFLSEVPDYVLPGYPNNGGYEFIRSQPISGPHNSYLSILARMGLIGAGLSLWLLLALFRQANLLIRLHFRTIPEILLLFIPLNGAIHAFFNVGFESPHHCMILWLTAGMLMVWRPPKNVLKSRRV